VFPFEPLIHFPLYPRQSGPLISRNGWGIHLSGPGDLHYRIEPEHQPMKNFSILIPFIFILCSCGFNRHQDNDPVTVKIYVDEDKFLSDMKQEKDYVPLPKAIAITTGLVTIYTAMAATGASPGVPLPVTTEVILINEKRGKSSKLKWGMNHYVIDRSELRDKYEICIRSPRLYKLIKGIEMKDENSNLRCDFDFESGLVFK
jgi:hypothetical protein